ncbi:MAG: B12-binding domain-containing radical SAM protein [Alphaproteobacteria bacterium]|nr:B12-binding domain-containing radical SAM protein [Alphaproteobacteria bacterium]
MTIAGDNLRIDRTRGRNLAKLMKISLISIEDGIDNIGFRKLSAYIRQINDKTDVLYVTTGNLRSIRRMLLGSTEKNLDTEDFKHIASEVRESEIVGFSSMTQYADVTAAIIAEVRKANPRALIVWGGIHPIIAPEEAILHADAVCTGEGEFAFEMLINAFMEGRSLVHVPGFWIRTEAGISKNANLPLQTQEDMDRLPPPTYQDGEKIYKSGHGFLSATPKDYVTWAGLSYNTVWSIGCPMRCTYCGNTKFIDYDQNYKKVRHASPRTIINEIKNAVAKHPHISTIAFHDDSFMALPLPVIQEFSESYASEVGLPFVVFGVIPNYIREEKMRLLLKAGMNRIRMGIQSGSQAVLDFYDRPTPVARIREACKIINKYADYMIPPAFDIILDNPIETVEDTRATLDLLHEMPKPYTLNIYSLRVMPNTKLADTLRERGIDVGDISTNYMKHVPTLGNIAVYVISLFNLPDWLFNKLRQRTFPTHQEQPHYPRLMLFVKFFFLLHRLMDHLRFMDFTVLTGAPGYIAWRIGLIRVWRRHFQPRFKGESP